MRWCLVNFKCRGVLLIWIRVGQGPTALAVGVGRGYLVNWTFFSRLSFSFYSPSLWETTRYRLKYCLKGPSSPKQPTNLDFPFYIIQVCLYEPSYPTSASVFIKAQLDKRDDFDFDIVNFPFLDADVPRSTSYGVYISQLIRFARVSSHVDC